MFSAGTKVYVHSSSITGKKLGPKRHSLGYISDTTPAVFVNYIKGFPIKNQSFVLSSNKIVFTRYGREQKERCETREFVQVIPVSSNGMNNSEIKKVMEILDSGELSKNRCWYDTACNYYNDPTNIGIIIPVKHIRAAKMKDNEMDTWINSILHNQNFSFLLRHNRRKFLIRKDVNGDIVSWLASASFGSQPRRELLAWAKNDESNMKNLIDCMRYLNIAFSKRMFDSNIKNIEKVIHPSGKVTDLTLYAGWITKGLFEADNLLRRKEKILKTLPINTSMLNLSKCIHLAHDTYLTIKPKYI